MRYTVTSDFTKITESAGTIQNTSNIYSIEVSAYQSNDTGIIVFPLNSISFCGAPVFVRCTDNAVVDVRVVTFTVADSSSSFDSNTVTIDGVTYTVASSAQSNSVVNAAFIGDTVPTDNSFNSSLDDIFSGNGSAASIDTDFNSQLDNIFYP